MRKKWKTIIKKSVAILAVTSLALGMVPVSKLQSLGVRSASAAVQTQGDYTYEILQDGTAKLVKYNGNASVISIPKKLGDAQVTEIGEKAFQYHFNLGRVRMPGTVKVIGDYAFNGCGKLEDIDFPKALTTLGDYAFCGCAKMEVVKLGDAEKLTKIGTSCFTRCINLEKVELGNGIETIGEFAFSECYGLKSLSIDVVVDDEGNMTGKLQEIKRGTFNSDSELSYVCFPENSIKRIEEFAFHDCRKLGDFFRISDAEYIGKNAFNGCDFNGDHTINAKELEPHALDGLTVNGKVVLNENIKELPEGCFAFAQIKELELGKSLEKIGDAAFEGAEIKDFDVPEENTTFAEVDNSLYSYDKTELIRISAVEKAQDDSEDEEDSEGEEDSEDEVKTEEYILPDGIKVIGDYAFNGTSLAKTDETYLKVVIPEGVEKIGKSAMSEMGLNSITVPDSVTSIGKSAFSGNEKLETVKFGKGVTEIPDKAFLGDEELKELSMGKNVTKIGEDAFAHCDMEQLEIGKAVTEISNQAFLNANIQSYSVDEDNTEFCSQDGDIYSKDMKKLCFVHYSKQKLDEDDNPINEPCPYAVKDGVTTIGSHAFSKTTYVTDITLPDGLQKLEPYALADINKCKEIRIPDTVTELGEKAVGYAFCDGEFYDLTVGMLLLCGKDSATAKYAKQQDIAYATEKPSLNKQEVTLKGNETFALDVKGMEIKEMYFTSTDSNIVSVDDNGVMTGRGKGSTYVVAAQGSYYLICKVTVTSDGTKLPTKFNAAGYKVINNDNAEEWVDNYYNYNANQDLSSNANYGIYVYSTNDYVAIKATYSDGDGYIKRAEDEFQTNYDRYHAFGEAAKREMSRYRIQEDTLIYSGISNLDKYTRKTSSLKDMKAAIGRTDIFDCFTSTTLHYGISKGYSGGWSSSAILRIYVPKDFNGGAYIDPFSHYSGEMEYLLAPGYKYEVVDAGVRVDESREEGGNGTVLNPQRFLSIRLIDDTKKEPTPSPKPTKKPTPKPTPTPGKKAVTSVTKSGITYKKSGKVAVVAKGKTTITKAKILDKVTIAGKQYKVTKIQPKAFASCKKLKSVALGANITTIGKKALYNCGALVKITWNQKVKSIGADAFKGIGADAFKEKGKKTIFKVKKAYYKKTVKILTKKTGFIQKTMTIIK